MANQYGLNRYGLPEATMDMPDNNTFGLLNIKPHKRKIYNTTPVTSDPEVILPGETETETKSTFYFYLHILPIQIRLRPILSRQYTN